MTTTNLYSGYDPAGKPSSRVINPPGGRSNNIFGGSDDPPAPRQKVEQQMAPKEPVDQNQNQNAGATSSPAQQTQAPQQKDGSAAPFASFQESGKPSNPTQFDKCDSGSQNDADFRCYSVTAYRDAVQQNAAVRQKARGQASSGFNPITHEESPSPFSDYEHARNEHHKQQSNPAQQRNGKLQQQNQGKVQYNPITGEPYPETYGNKNKKEEKKDEEEESTGENAEKQTEENMSENAKPTGAPEQQPTKQPNKPSVKVRQPPGGASSGLW